MGYRHFDLSLSFNKFPWASILFPFILRNNSPIAYFWLSKSYLCVCIYNILLNTESGPVGTVGSRSNRGEIGRHSWGHCVWWWGSVELLHVCWPLWLVQETPGREWEQGLWCSVLADHPPLCGITSEQPLRNGAWEDYNWRSTSYSLGDYR